MTKEKELCALARGYARAINAAENAAEDSVTYGWWRRGGADIALPCKSVRASKRGRPEGNFWVGFVSIPFATR